MINLTSKGLFVSMFGSLCVFFMELNIRGDYDVINMEDWNDGEYCKEL